MHKGNTIDNINDGDIYSYCDKWYDAGRTFGYNDNNVWKLYDITEC